LTIGGTTIRPSRKIAMKRPRKTARIAAGRGSFMRAARSTAGPSATARKTAISSRPTTERTR
jgi:hypothetical protein